MSTARHTATPSQRGRLALGRAPGGVSPWIAAALLALLPLLSGCDNPACIFAAGGCWQSGGGGTLGSQPATNPSNGVWIDPAAPVVESMVPSDDTGHPDTPIAITFSESLAPGSLTGAFELLDGFSGASIPLLDPPPVVGDGRMVILDPLTPLAPGVTYVVRFVEGAQPTDLTGQLVEGLDQDVGAFSIAISPPTAPRVIASFPPDLAVDQSDIGELVVVFDREMDDSASHPFDTNSWSVTVDGSAPAVNPVPTPLLAGPVEIPSVWRWSSIDPVGQNRLSLGAGVAVELELSQPGNKLADADGNELPATVIDYDTADIAVPALLTKGPLAPPSDAIGRPNLTGTDAVLSAQLLSNAEAGDVLDLYLFGRDPASGVRVAFSRSVPVASTTLSIAVSPAALALLEEGVGLFEDGNLYVAAGMRRGGLRTAVRVFDADLGLPGVQPLLFDLTPPSLIGLGTQGTDSTTFASDLRNAVIVGRGNEPIRRVEVSLDSGENNGVDPDVAMGADDGLFVAREVRSGNGVFDPSAPPTYTISIYDRALNPAASSVSGTFEQRGAVTGADPGGGTIEVQVFDAASLEPVAGALVMVHQDAGGVYSAVAGGSGITDADGRVSVPAAAVGTLSIVTVDQAGYDLWTLHGVPTDTLGVPLVATGSAPATTLGSVSTAFPLVDLTSFTNRVGDSRLAAGSGRLIPVESCDPVAPTARFECPFGPAVVAADRVGAQFFLSGDFSLSEAAFTPLAFLQAYGERFAIAPLGAGNAAQGVSLPVDTLLATSLPEEQPLAMPSQSLDVAAVWGPSFGALAAPPTVTVEALAPGLPAALPVGLGIAYDTGGAPGPWSVLGAYPGVCDGIDDGGGDQLGELVTGGTIDGDLFVRVELVDTAGNLVGARPRFSHDDSILDPPDLPQFKIPGPGGGSGGLTYLIVASDVIPDSFGMAGIYRYQVRGADGRGWALWRFDPAGSGDVTTLVPDIGLDFGGTPLGAGTATMAISAWAWQDFDPTAFLWTDIEREHEVFAHTAPAAFVIEN